MFVYGYCCEFDSNVLPVYDADETVTLSLEKLSEIVEHENPVR